VAFRRRLPFRLRRLLEEKAAAPADTEDSPGKGKGDFIDVMGNSIDDSTS